MKIHSALKEFAETYDRTAIQSIEDISRDIALANNKTKIKVFTIKEGFDVFSEFLNGYANYKIELIGKEDKKPQSLIVDHTKSYIKEQLFNECDILYGDLPLFIEGYVNGVKSLTGVVDDVTKKMMEAGVDEESVSSINEFMDTFIDRLHESFNPTMNHILWASGYNSRTALRKKEIKELKPVFL